MITGVSRHEKQQFPKLRSHRSATALDGSVSLIADKSQSVDV